MKDTKPPSLLIIGARAADAERDYPTLCVGLRDGLVAHAAPEPPDGDWDLRIDADGLLLLPGWSELSARLREPGATHKADIASELAAAAAAGITSVCMPPDTHPVIDRPSVVDWIRTRVATSGTPVSVHLLGAATADLAGEQLSEMGALATAGCRGVMQVGAPLHSTAVMRRVLEYARGFDLTVHVQPQDAALAGQGCAHEGAMATRLGLSPVPVAAETLAIGQWLALVEATGARVHFGRLSSARGADMLKSARAAGLPVTADVALHQLLLTDAAIEGFDSRAHLQPPLRSAADRDALRRALAGGDIQALCCDHQPHNADAKNEPFDLSAPGASGLDSAWGLALQLVTDGIIDLPTLVRACHAEPQRILGLTPTQWRVGAPADGVLIDAETAGVVDPRYFRSRGRNTPLSGQPMTGRICATVQAGAMIFDALDGSRRRG